MIRFDHEAFEERYLQELNPQQHEAVMAVDGNVLLLATPGSGKTTVLVKRLGYMVCSLGIPPESILTMTYTRAATADMKNRFAAIFGGEAAANLQFRTINGVSSKIIEYVSSRSGRQAFGLLDDEAERTSLIRHIYQEINKEYAEDSLVKEIKTQITYIKNMMLSDEEVTSFKTNVENLPALYRLYQEELRSRQLMDYDDQLIYAYKMLENIPDVLGHFQDQYHYICVDEAQDTSRIQHEIIKLLAAGHGNLFMVGDEDQSIYGFRAAYPEALLHFETDHPGAKVLLMEENYRSTPEIISLANRFIAQNLSRHEKAIRATRSSGSPVHIVHCKDREAQFLLLLEMAGSCDCETAILFRNNDSALPLIDLFESRGISYNCKNVDDVFFTHRVVSDVLDILRFAYEPSNGDIFMRIYYKFDVRISKMSAAEAVERSRRSKKPILEELMHVSGASSYVQDAVFFLAKDLAKVKEDSAEAAIRRVWESMHYGRYVETRGYDQGKYFILCQLAKDAASVEAFTAKLERLRSCISAHANDPDHKVILSTIHSSKGLEYDRVFLLDILDGILPCQGKADRQTEEDERVYEEERRLYYVGMTRARNDLFLFSCNMQSGFTDEACAYIPSPVYDRNDVFYFLTAPLIGKAYADCSRGTGEIEAQCEDLFFVRFADGALCRMRLEEMVVRRDKTAVAIQPAPKMEPAKKSPRVSLSEKQAAQRLTAGMPIGHRTFGEGIVQSVQPETGIITVEFHSGKVKNLQLSTCLEKGLLYF